MLTKTEVSTSLPLLMMATYPTRAKFFELHKHRTDTLGGESATPQQQMAERDVQIRVIVVEEEVLHEINFGRRTSRNLRVQDCPHCLGRNHEVLHEPPAFSVHFDAHQGLESLQ